MQPQPQIRVVLVDDHRDIHDALQFRLEREPDILLLGRGFVGPDILTLIQQRSPDVAIIDIRLPSRRGESAVQLGFDTLGAVQKALASFRDTKIILYSSDLRANHLHTAMKAGVHGYILKGDHVLSANIAQAVRDVAAGQRVFSDEAVDLWKVIGRGVATTLKPTKAQLKYLELFQRHLTANENDVANLCGVTVHAVRSAMRDLRQRWQLQARVTNRALVQLAIERGWLPLQPDNPIEEHATTPS